MTDQQLIIAVAKLDGKLTSSVNENNTCFCEECVAEKGLNYLTSHDAIIPVIEKQSEEIQAHVWFWIVSKYIPQLRSLNDVVAINLLPAIIRKATPKQLSIALVKATGKWEE